MIFIIILLQVPINYNIIWQKSDIYKYIICDLPDRVVDSSCDLYTKLQRFEILYLYT